MTEEQVRIGGVYRYILYASRTGELLVDCVVEVVKLLSDEACRFKILAVLKDDSGNGYYRYIHATGKETNGSYKYMEAIKDE